MPLSVQYMGIYHELEKAPVTSATGQTKTEFLLKYERSFWKFWQNGAQDFLAEPDDKVVCFARIFAPARFKDEIIFHWLKYERGRWQTMDKVKNQISGGRDAGYRALAVKANYDVGDWRVQIETTDGREIGRIHFTIEKSPHKNLARTFMVDRF